MRVVIDTNVLVSALLTAGSIPEAVVTIALGRVVEWIATDAVLAEYQEVLARPKLAIDKSKADTALASIREASVLVTAGSVVYACSDPDDNRFLECAQAGDADYLVSGNLKHFPQQWGITRIVSPRQFIDICTALLS